jgi:hypothetical protein
MDTGTALSVVGPQDGLVTSVVVSAAATAEAAIPYIGSGGVNRFLSLQAVGAAVHIIFGVTGMAAPSLTANSIRLVDGVILRCLVPPGCTHFRTIATGAGVLLISPSSP